MLNVVFHVHMNVNGSVIHDPKSVIIWVRNFVVGDSCYCVDLVMKKRKYFNIADVLLLKFFPIYK